MTSNSPRRLRSLYRNPALIWWTLCLVLGSGYLLTDKLRRYLRRRNIDEVNPDRWFRSTMTPDFHRQWGERTGPHVVFVGASYGELVIMRQLSAALQSRSPNTRISWTIRDRHTIKHLMEGGKSPPVAIWPFDFIVPVNRYFQEVRPDVLVLTERFRFPTFVCGAAFAGVKVVLTNGRCRRKVSVWSRLTNFYYRWTFSALNTMLLQGEEDLDVAKEFASPSAELVVTGDIKLDLRQAEVAPDVAASLAKWLRDDEGIPLLVAGSTDSADEERFVLRSFLKAQEQFPCRLLIAPRRTERRAELLALAEEFGLRASLRSRPADNADFLILDTLGELAHAYQYGQAAYVGGAWDGMGHNVTEPVVWGVPVAYGIRRGHFAALQKLCEEYGVGFRVADDSDLADFWRMVLGSPERQAELREACHSLIVRQSGSFEATLAGIVRAVERAYS